MDISDALKAAAEYLAGSGLSEPVRDSNSLLSIALKKDRLFLISNPDYQLTPAEENAFLEYLARRKKREPLQHIAEKQEFWGLEFRVTAGVLVPRPETERIVEETVSIFDKDYRLGFCEIGIGSGCISVSILTEFPHSVGSAYDISGKALSVAGENAERHGVNDRLTLGISDVFNSIAPHRFDLIVSNPPYVNARDVPFLQAEVRDYDPIEALTDGKDGFSIIRRIVLGSPKYLRPGGLLLMEIGFNQAEEVSRMFDPRIWHPPEFLPDLQGIPRIVKASTSNSKEFSAK